MPDCRIFAEGVADLEPQFLHGVQNTTENFEKYLEKLKCTHGCHGITMEPEWSRWNDPILFDPDDLHWKQCIDTAAILRKHHMFSWIYDEPGYPSGSLGIRALEGHDELVQIGVELITADGKCGETLKINSENEIINVFALKVTEGTITQKLHLDKPEFSIPDGNWKLCVFCKAPLLEGTIPHIRRRGVKPDHTISKIQLWGYPDLLDKDASQRFIDVAYEPYSKYLGDYLGTELRAFFTDEPTIPFRHYFAPEIPAALPWCRRFDQIFEEKYGYDIKAHLPELFFSMENSDIIRIAYFDLVSELYYKNFTSYMSDWCMKHGMYFTGHMLHEEHLCTQALCSGSLLRAVRGMSMPGTDNLSMGFPGRGVGAKMSVVGTSSQNGAVTPKLISSAAHLSGTPRTASESHGWSSPDEATSFAPYIATSNWQYVLGVNTLPYYTMDWVDRTDRDYHAYNKYVSRLSYMTSGGKHIAPTAVLYPICSVWAGLSPLDQKLPSVAGLNPHEREYWYYCANEHILKLQNIFDDTCHGLLSRQNDFDYLEDSDIANADITDGILCVSGMKFQNILLPGCEYLSLKCCQKLIEFADHGGTIYLAGIKPKKIYDADAQDMIETLCHHTNVHFEESSERACEKIAAVSICPKLSNSSPDVYILHLKKEQSDLFFIANNSYVDYNGTYVLPVTGTPQLWEPMNGKVYSLPFKTIDGKTYINARLAGWRAHLIVFDSTAKPCEAYDFNGDYGYPKAEGATLVSRIFEEKTAIKYCGTPTPASKYYADAQFVLHAPAGGLTLSDKQAGQAVLTVAPDYRSGEIIEGLCFPCHLDAGGVYKFTLTMTGENLNFWGVMPRHFDKNGTELIDAGGSNWRDEFSVQMKHKPTEFSIWFRVPKDAAETKIMVCPLCKECFEHCAKMYISNAYLSTLNHESESSQPVE